MSSLAGILGITDSNLVYANTVGQSVIYEGINKVLAEYDAELTAASSLFIEKTTEDFASRYLLSGGGYLQEMNEFARAAAMHRSGSYDVGFPLRHFGVEFGGSRIGLAHMSVADIDSHLKNVKLGALNTLRKRILIALMDRSNFTFPDPLRGNITVRRLANTDGTIYDPVLGSATAADDEHYHDAAYAVNAIADANNPALTLRNEIAEHFGGVAPNGQNFVYFHGADQTSYLQAITGYTAIPDQYVSLGNDTAYANAIPMNVPGIVHGRVSGVWLSEWDGWIPDEYGLCILADVGAPLHMRVDPANLGLGQGLQLVTTSDDYPLLSSSFEHRFGLGVANRLSAACIEINSGGGTYSSPSDYAE